MKAISRQICGTVLALVLGVIVPVVRADDMADWWAERQRQDEECRRKAQEEREAADRAYQQAQQEQAARDKADYEAQQQREAQDKAQADREARDQYWRDVQAAQDERAAWYKWDEEERQRWEKQRQEQEWEEWMNRGREDWWGAGSNSNSPYSYAVPRPPVILNPFVQHKASEDQEKARQQATQSGQQMIENPFVRSPK